MRRQVYECDRPRDAAKAIAETAAIRSLIEQAVTIPEQDYQSVMIEAAKRAKHLALALYEMAGFNPKIAGFLRDDRVDVAYQTIYDLEQA